MSILIGVRISVDWHSNKKCRKTKYFGAVITKRKNVRQKVYLAVEDFPLFNGAKVQCRKTGYRYHITGFPSKPPASFKWPNGWGLINPDPNYWRSLYNQPRYEEQQAKKPTEVFYAKGGVETINAPY